VELLHRTGQNLCHVPRASEKQLLGIERFILYLAQSGDRHDEVIAHTPAPLATNASLKRGILGNDFRAIVDYFRPLLTERPQLLGVKPDTQTKKVISFAIVKNGSAPYVEEIYAGFLQELSVNKGLSDLGIFPTSRCATGRPQSSDSEDNRRIINTLLNHFAPGDDVYLVPIRTAVSMVSAQHFAAHRIIFCGVSDPVRAGLISREAGLSSGHGIGNIAGVAYSVPVAETVELLSQAFPSETLGFVYNGTDPAPQDLHLRDEILASATYGTQVKLVDIRFPEEIARYRGIVRIFFGRYFLCSNMKQFVAANSPDVAFVGVSPFNVAVGALMSIGHQPSELGRLLVTRILVPHLREQVGLPDLGMHAPPLRKILLSKSKLAQCGLTLNRAFQKKGIMEFVQ
jgi:hypothetical protein